MNGAYDEAEPYGVFALLRYDQMYELATLMTQEAPSSSTISPAAAKAALMQMGTQLKAIEWEHHKYDPYELYRHHRQNESHDNRMIRWARVPTASGLPATLEHVAGIDSAGDYAKIKPTFVPSVNPNGRCEISIKGRPRLDARRLDFAADS